jgi:hypothetical protein
MLNFVSYPKGRNQIENFGTKILRRIYGPRKREAREEWRKLHNE